MTVTFNNSGNVGAMGEEIINHGSITGQHIEDHSNIDWDALIEEISKLSQHDISSDTVQELNQAAINRSDSDLKEILSAKKITYDFLVSVGASILAGLLL